MSAGVTDEQGSLSRVGLPNQGSSAKQNIGRATSIVHNAMR
jgi:hypothetical protein